MIQYTEKDLHCLPKSIVPDTLYQWCGHGPYLGLEHVQDLDIESKQKMLFGRCDVQLWLPSELQGVMFDMYLELDVDLPMEKIYFPVFFLSHCAEFASHFDQDWCWPRHRNLKVACLMNKPRYQRLIASCWMSNHKAKYDFGYTQNWRADLGISALDELLQIGGLRDWTGEWGPKVLQMPENNIGRFEDRGTIENFILLNQTLYSQAASCVVIGAVCWERACEICEKYLYAVYAGCIPLVQGYHIYDRLQDLGFDIFDDIIDTSSQHERNPVIAAWNLWDRNQDFFTNACDIFNSSEIQSRLRHNLELARNIRALYNNSLTRLNSVRAQELFAQHRAKIWQRFAHNIDFHRYLQD